MPFDSELVMHDGTTITADIAPTSLTRTGGSAVIDLRETPAKGLACVLVMGADLAEASDTILVTIEECATVGGTYAEVARFPLLTKGTGMPGTYIRRFSAEEQFVRAKIDVVDADAGADFTVANVFILLAYHPFKRL